MHAKKEIEILLNAIYMAENVKQSKPLYIYSLLTSMYS